MPYKPFYISSFENDSGLDQSKKSFLIPEKAFPELEDAYAWRGRIKRRRGFLLLGRLRRCLTDYNFLENQASPWTFNIKVVSGFVETANNANPGQVTTTYPHELTTGDIVVISDIVGATGYNAVEFTITVVDPLNFTVGVDAGAFGVYVSGGKWISNRSLSATEPNAEIQPGSVVITLPGPIVFTDQGDGTLTSPTGGNSGTINYFTGEIVLIHTAAATDITILTYCYFPSLPVMGLRTRESSVLINDEELIAFDTVYAYRFAGNQFFELAPGTTWSGENFNFFWTTNFWQNISGDLMWVTNFSGPTKDPIRYFDGVVWTDFLPLIRVDERLQQSLILLPYKDRLLAMNTWEGTTLAGSANFPQRIRFSQNGDPADQVDGWLETTVGRGGFIDVPTNEAIVSAEFIKDTLLIKCERSSWKVFYTGNEILPFVLQQINTELGAESTFSIVPFDRGVFTVGNYGITADDSINVARIDQRIPDIVFSFNNDNEGVKRVYGIRNFQEQIVYWSFPNSVENPTFPNKILVYNYINRTYSIFNDSFTCFGDFQKASDDIWANLKWSSWSAWEEAWNSGLDQSKFPDIIGGNQQGYVEILNKGVFNAVSLSITSIASAAADRITVPNHNLQTGRFVKITEAIGYTQDFVAEIVGIALTGSTTFTGFLDNSPIQSTLPSSLTIIIGPNIFTDNGNGTLDLAGNIGGTINYNSGEFTANFTSLLIDTPVTASYTQTLNGGIFKIIRINNNELDLTKYNFQTGIVENFSITLPTPYLGVGKLTVLNNINIFTKRFSPYYTEGSQVRVEFLDFFMEKTESGEVTVNVFINENSTISINDPDSASNDGLLGDNIVLTRPENIVLFPFETQQEKIWHRLYVYSLSQNFQFQITFDDAQMSNEEINSSDVILHAMILYLTDNVRLI